MIYNLYPSIQQMKGHLDYEVKNGRGYRRIYRVYQVK